MTLKEWRVAEEKSQDVVSGLLRVTQAYYSKIELGRRSPSLELAARIIRLTKGKVTATEIAPKAAT